METSISPSETAERLSCFHFVLLHHGYHGQARDLYYLSGIAEDAMKPAPNAGSSAAPSASPHFVFVHPKGNDRLQTEEGVLACARRYVDHACATIEATLMSAIGADEKAVAKSDHPARLVEVHVSAVGHSMGGLILRAAFPAIERKMEQLVAQLPQVQDVHWDTFCTMATPHLGVHYMRSPVMTFLGGSIGHHVSPAIADLFAKNTLLTCDLVTDKSLAAWARFKRRVILNVVNDGTVLVHSSSFVMPVSVRRRIGAALPTTQPASPPSCHSETPVVPVNSKGDPSETAVAKAARGPSHDQSSSKPQKVAHLDVPNTDASVLHLAQHGIYCASTVAGLRRNAYELTELSEDLWPSAVLPQPRALAEHILNSVGPLELHLLDFRPLRDAPVECLPKHVAEARAELSVCGRMMTHLGAHRFSHAAMACKSPFYYPAFFGFASEYVVSDLLGIPLTINGLAGDTQDAAFSSV